MGRWPISRSARRARKFEKRRAHRAFIVGATALQGCYIRPFSLQGSRGKYILAPDIEDGLNGSFGKIADDVPQILWSVDGEGRHDYVNRQLREFVGERIDTVDAETWTTLVHPDDWERVERKRVEILTSNEPMSLSIAFDITAANIAGYNLGLRRSWTRTGACCDGTERLAIPILKNS